MISRYLGQVQLRRGRAKGKSQSAAVKAEDEEPFHRTIQIRNTKAHEGQLICMLDFISSGRVIRMCVAQMQKSLDRLYVLLRSPTFSSSEIYRSSDPFSEAL